MLVPPVPVIVLLVPFVPPPPPPPVAGVPMEAPKSADGKEPPRTARQEIQQRRQEAARKNATQDMNAATSLEAQKKVQDVVLQAMGFSAGFDAYGKLVVPDGRGYRPFSVYDNQRTVDNRRNGNALFGPTDRLHNELVDLQYKKD